MLLAGTHPLDAVRSHIAVGWIDARKLSSFAAQNSNIFARFWLSSEETAFRFKFSDVTQRATPPQYKHRHTAPAVGQSHVGKTPQEVT